MDLFDLVAKLTLDSSEYENGLNESESVASSFGDKLKNTLGAAGKVGGVALGAVTAAGTAAVGAFVSGTKSLAEYGDNIDKMSQKMGLSRQAYQEWDAVMQHSGTSIDGMARGMTSLSKAVENGDDSFAKLGLSLEDVQNMSQEDLFSTTITALQNMESGTERTVLAQKLLGGSAKELGALLNTSAADTEAMRQKVHELGGVMSDEAVMSAAAFQDSLQDMQTSISGLGRGLLSEFLPSITGIMDGITAVFSGDSGGAQMISQGVSDMISKIGEAIPQIIDTGTELMSSFLDIIIENLPEIVSAGTEILIKLTTGIIEALPDLIAKAPEIIQALVTAIIENAPALLQASTELIKMIGQGIVDNFPKLVQKGHEIIDKIKSAILEKVHEAKTWGSDLISNFVSGITGGMANLGSAVAGVGQKVRDYIGFSEPKEGPLSDFHTFAPDMMELFAKGIKDNENVVTDQIGKSFDFGSGIATATPAVSGGANVNINVYGAEGQSEERLAEIVMDKMYSAMGMREAAIV